MMITKIERHSLHEVTDRLKLFKDFAFHCWNEFGSWIYEEWARLNKSIYNDELELGGIVWGLTPHGGSLGFYSLSFNIITLHSSLVDPRSSAPWGIPAYRLNKLFASDVLLHEMIHQKNHQNGELTNEDLEGTSSHNCTAWVDEVNRIAPILGLNVKASICRQRRVWDDLLQMKKRKWIGGPGCMDLSALSRFPHSARPKSYYGHKDGKDEQRKS